MKYLSIISIFLVLLLFIASVNAANNETQVLSADDSSNEVISIDNNDNNTNILSNTNSETLNADSGTFSELRGEVGSGGNIVLSKKLYTYDSGGTISIGTSNSVIDGNGTVIDMTGANIKNVFFVEYWASGVTFKNITFINATYGTSNPYDGGDGAAIYFNQVNSGTITDCNFINCHLTNSLNTRGGALFIWGDVSVTNCNFDSCNALSGGAIYFKYKTGGGYRVTNCNFTNNKATNRAGAIYYEVSSKTFIDNCNFIDNTAPECSAVYAENAEMTNCLVVGLGSPNGHAINSGVKTQNCTFLNRFPIIANFSDLISEVGSGGDMILSCDFYYYDYGNTIEITQPGVIDGNNSVIDMAGSDIGVFIVKTAGVTFKNLNIINANLQGGNGSAIYFEANGTVTDCTFTNNTADYGGAIYFYQSGSVNYCNFTSNNATRGSAIYFNGKGTAYLCNFENNVGINVYRSSDSTYSKLKSKIENSSDGNIILNGETYYYDYGDTIEINTHCVIDGRGAVIDMSGSNIRAFIVKTSDATFKNITFINTNLQEGSGGAIYFEVGGTLIDCSFFNNTAVDGGAVYSDGADIINCTFSDNSANNGGAIFITGSSVTNCTFSGNSATTGGAVYANSNDNLINCTFSGNSASNGGAAYLNGGSMTDCTFSGNSATTAGAAYLNGGSMTDCTFSGNSASINGGAAYLNSGSMTDCTFSDNSASNGGAAYLNGGSVISCNFVNNTVNFYINQYGGYSGSCGGAVYLYSVYGNQKNHNLINSTFRDNNGYHGGAIYIVNYARVNTDGCNFSDNSARDGGAIYSDCYLSFTITDSNFVNNTAYRTKSQYGDYYEHGIGGAIYLYGGGTVSNCSFVNNTGESTSGAIYFGSEGAVTDCSFVNNTANESAGALYFAYGGTVADCDFTDNSAWYGGAIFFSDEASVNVNSSDFVNNAANNGDAIYINYGDIGTIANSNFFSPDARNKAISIENSAVISIDNCYFGDKLPVSGNFSDLILEIGVGGDITLTKDFYYYDYGDTIVITQPGVIDGKGAVIDMAGSNIRVFNVTTAGVTFKDITFKNANIQGENGSAIFFTSNGTVIDCNFINNTADYGGAIYVNQSADVDSCTFKNNTAILGSSIYFNNEGTYDNCKFSNEVSSVYYAKCGYYSDLKSEIEDSYGDIVLTNSIYMYDFGDTIEINEERVIDGNGAVIDMLGSPSMRIFKVNVDGVIFKNITFKNAHIYDVEDYDYDCYYNGGAIYFVGDGTVIDCTFINNLVNFNLDYYVYSTYGGAIYVCGYGTVINCTFINNTASDGGGAVCFGGEGTVSNSIFIGNDAFLGESSGGAICFVSEGTVSNSIFIGNNAANGGAIYYEEGGTVSNCNFVNNTAIAGPYYDYNSIPYQDGLNDFLGSSYMELGYSEMGGAIYSYGYTTVTDSNFTNNKACLGGAFYSCYGNFYLNNCKFINNLAFIEHRGGLNYYDGYCASGGAIYSSGEGSVINCILDNNTAENYGGAMFFGSEPGSIDNCNITNNYAYYDGGAIYFTYNGNVANCNFINNTAEDNGGALYFNFDAYGSAVNCLFMGNTADYGGAIYGSDSIYRIDLSNSPFIGNSADNGGAIYLGEYSSADITDCNFTGNNASIGSALYIGSDPNEFTISNTILLDNRADSKLLTLTRNGDYLELVFTGEDNLLNAIYSESEDIILNNVIYRDANGIANTDSGLYVYSDRERGQNIIVTFSNGGFSMNMDMITGSDGDVSIDLSRIQGNYRITAYHPCDSYYTESNHAVYDSEQKIPCEITVIANDPICVGDIAIFTITMNCSIDAIVTLEVDDEIFHVAVVGGEGIFNVSGLANHTYDITVTFDGDDNYRTATNHTTLKVNKVAEYPLDVFVNDITYGEDETVVINLPVDVDSDKLTVKVDGIVREHTLCEGVATVIVSGLAAGPHVVDVTYAEDDKYLTKNNNSNTFTVSAAVTSDLDLIVDNHTYGENTTFTVTLPSGASENVTISIDGVDYSVKPVSTVATLVLNNISGGFHVVIASYSGGDVGPCSASATFIIPRATSTIDVNFTHSVSVGDNVLINVTMGQDINGTVILRLNNENYTVVIVNGKGNYTIRNIASDYTVKAEFAGNENYMASESEVKQIEIDRLDSTTFVEDVSIKVGELAEILVRVTPGATGEVTVTVNGTIVRTVGLVDSEAVVYIKDLPIGEYDIKAVYAGDGCYGGSQNTTAKVTVGLNPVDLVAIATNTTVGGQSIVEMVLPIDAQGTITIDDITENVVNGRATITLPVETTAGLKTITITYNGDNVKYDTKTIEISYNVSKSTSGIVIEVENVYFVGENIIINLTKNNSTGDVSVTINDEPYNVTNSQVIIPGGLAVDSYTIVASLTGDDNYLSSTATASFEVVKYGSDIEIDIKDVYYVGEDIVIGLNPVNSTGAVSVTINGKSYNVTGNNVTIAGGLAAGDYNIVAILDGDDNFTGIVKSADFTVVKNNVNLTIDVSSDVDVNESKIITVKLNVTDIVGIVIISVNGVDYSTPINGDVATLTLNNLENVTYTVKAYFNGNDKYLANESNEIRFNVKKLPSAIGVEDVEISVGEIAEITVTVTPGATGIVTVTVNDNSQNVSLVDSSAVVYVKGLAKGEYNITAVYNGDGCYVGSENVTAKVTVGLNAPNIIAIATNTTVGGQAVVEIILPGDAQGTITIGDKTETLVNGRATVTLPAEETAGLKGITVNYSGDDVKYGANSVDITYNVAKSTSDVIIDVNSTFVFGEDIVINLTKVNSTGDISVTINGKSYNVTDNQVIIEGGLPVTSYTIVASLDADDNYKDSTATASFEVIKDTSDIEIDVRDVYLVGEDIVINLTAVNSTGDISVTINGKSYNVTGNNVTISGGLPAGDYNIIASLAGDGSYDAVVSSADFTVVKNNVNLTIDSISDAVVGESRTVTVTLSVSDIVGNVVISVNNMNYLASVDGNTTTLTLNNLENVTYTVKAYFNGNDKYLTNESNEVTFNVEKVTSTTDVEDVSISVGEIAEITVTVTPGATGIVTVTVNGSSQSVSLIDSSAVVYVKGLAKGEYNITAVYNGDSKFIKSENVTAKVVVGLNTVDIVAIASNTTVGGQSVVEIILPADAQGTITIDDTTETLVNGRATVTLPAEQSAGLKTVTVNYSGDDIKYGANSVDITYNVAKSTSAIDIEVDEIYLVGEDIVVNLTVVNSTGDVSVTINGEEYNVTEGNQVIIEGGLAADSYTIVANLDADDNYEASTATADFYVIRDTSDIIIKVNDTYFVGEDIVICLVPVNSTGTITVTINGKSYNVTEDNEVVISGGLAAGDYNIIASLAGDGSFDSVVSSADFTVVKNNVNLTIDGISDAIVGESRTITVTLSVSDIVGNVIISVNNVNYLTPVDGNVASLTLNNLENISYTVKAYFNGNDKYLDNESNEVTFNVNMLTSATDVEDVEINVGEIAEITVTVTPGATGIVTVTVNGNSQNVSLVDSSAVVYVKDLTEGEYNITAVYNGDNKYVGSENVTAKVIVNLNGVNIVAIPSNTVVGGQAVVEIILPVDAQGSVTIGNITETLVNGRATVTLPVEESAGLKTITVNYSGDDVKYDESSISVLYNVSKSTSAIEIAVEDAYLVGEDIVINLNPVNSTGNISVSVNGEEYNVTEGNQVIIEGGLTADSYTIVANLDADDNYEASTATADFYVIRDTSDIIIKVNDTYFVGEDIIIGLVPVNSTGTITVTINGKSYNITEDNEVVIDGGLAAGDYNVVASLAGDGSYDPVVSSADFTVVKNNLNLTIDVNVDATIGESSIITVTLNVSDIVGNVIISVNDVDYSAPINGDVATLTLSNLENITYTVKAYFNGNDKYLANESNEITFNVNKLPSTTGVEDVEIEAGEVAEITITVTEGATGIVTVTVNGTTQNASLVDSQAVVYVKGLSKGEYNITAVYNGDGCYIGSENVTAKVIVGLNIPSIIAIASNTVVGGQSVVEIILPSDAQGKVLVNDVISEDVVNGRATVILPVEETAGLKGVTVIYSGDDVKYDATEANALYNVTKATSGIVIIVDDTYLVGKDIVINLTTINSTGNLSVSINDESYNVTGDNQVIIPGGLAVDSYTIVATLDGDDNYKSSTASANFEVIRESSAIEIDVSDVYFVGEDIVIGLNPVNSTGDITVTINGKSYNVTDNQVIIDGGLAVGDYNVVATLAGDISYDGATNSTDFKVVKNNVEVILYAIPDAVVGDSKIISVNLNVSDIVGNVIISVNGVDYSATINGSVATLTLYNLENITYTVKARFNGNDKYLANESGEVSFNVNKIISTTSVEDVSINVGEVAEITVTVTSGASGMVTVTVNDNTQIVSLVNSKAVVYVKDLAKGEYDITAVYDGDYKYLGSFNITAKVVVDLNEPNLVAIATNATVGTQSIVEIITHSDAKGNVTIGNITKDIVDGRATIVLPVDETPGLKTITVVYSGDDVKYYNKTITTTYYVADLPAKLDTDLLLDVDVENATLTVTLAENATGEVTVVMNGEKIAVENVVNGTVVVSLGELTVGNYTIDAIYAGDDKYNPANNQTAFEIPKISDYPFDLDVDVDTNLMMINVTLPEDVNGFVIIDVGDISYYVNIANGKGQLKINNLDPGYYDIIANFLGNEKYSPGSVNDSANINGAVITVNDLTKYYHGPERLNITVASSKGEGIANKTVLISINGVTYTRTTDENGLVSFGVNLSPGNYTARIDIPAYNFDKLVSIEVKNTIISSNVVKMFRNGTQYYALYLDSQGNPLPDMEVSFNLNGVIYKRVTNGTGWARMNLNLNPGEYVLSATNPVTGEVRANNITIISLIESKDLTKYYGNTTPFVARIHNADGSYVGAGESVRFNINGVYYTRTTNATGHVSLNINLNPGAYVITSYYKDCVKGDVVVIVPILEASDLEMKYRDGSKFTVKLLDTQGRPNPGQVVTFNINGVFYNRTTDANGIARLNINLIFGEYIITTSYGGTAIANKITITN